MTIWACARQGEPTTWHDSEREAESHKRLVEADGKGEPLVYAVEPETENRYEPRSASPASSTRGQPTPERPRTGDSGPYRGLLAKTYDRVIRRTA